MRRTLSLTFALFALVAAFVVPTAGCQTYDFEPVVPLALSQKTETRTIVAINNKPNLMLVVDKSGSMETPIDVNGPNCTVGCGLNSPCPAGCKTRISELRAAMANFLDTSGKIGRFGLMMYPNNASCGAATPATLQANIRVDFATSDDDAALQAAANQAKTEIQNVGPGGGTPTSSALGSMVGYGKFADKTRKHFVLLLTDGLPNCNEGNAHTCVDGPAVCKCTQPQGCGTTSGEPLCKIGCLDADASVTSIQSLRAQNVSTIVVGFGAETSSGDGPAALSAMAAAGGFARSCPNGTDAECPGDSCNVTTKLCNRPFFQAANAAELTEQLRKITDVIVSEKPCEQALPEKPSDPRLLAVYITEGLNGTATRVEPSDATWHYDATLQQVIFTDPLCAKLKQSTIDNPITTEFRIVQTK